MQQEAVSHEHVISALQIQNQSLSANLATAEEQIRQLLATFVGEKPIPLCFGLTHSEATILRVLMRREIASKEALFATLYNFRPDGSYLPDQKIVDIFMCLLRKKLRPFGPEIRTKWGQGYYMPAPSKVLVEEILERENAPQRAVRA